MLRRTAKALLNHSEPQGGLQMRPSSYTDSVLANSVLANSDILRTFSDFFFIKRCQAG